jgi:hypothetical protein
MDGRGITENAIEYFNKFYPPKGNCFLFGRAEGWFFAANHN